VDAYVYSCPIMSMDVSRKQFTNGTTDLRGPATTFVNVPEYPPAKGRLQLNLTMRLYSPKSEARPANGIRRPS
jgi:hypothetical protein